MDYTRKADAAIFMEATKSLDMTFDVEKLNLRVFMVELAQCAQNFRWNDVLTVAVNGNDRYMPDSYGVITTNAAQVHIDAYLNQ